MNRFSLVCAGYLLIALIMIPLKQIAGDNLWNSHSEDETSYMAHATVVAFGQFPDYTREWNMQFPGNYAFGPGWAASPFVFLFSLVDRVQNSAVVADRTPDMATGAWAPFGFTFATQVWVLVGLWFNWRACREAGGAAPGLAVLLTSAASSLPFFAMCAPVNSHAYEYAAVSFALWLVMAARSGRLRWGGPLFALALLAGVAAFLMRYNDVTVAVLFPAAALLMAPPREGAARPPRRWLVILTGIFLLVDVILAVRFFVYDLATQMDRNFWMTHHLHQKFFFWQGLGFYAKRLAYVLFASDWGLAWLGAPLIAGVAFLTRLKSRWLVAGLLAPIAVNFAMAVSWGNQGASYGYRYVTLTAAPLAALGWSLWLNHSEQRRARLAVFAALCAFPILCVLSYRAWLHLHIDYFDTVWGQAWTAPRYAARVAEGWLSRPFFSLERLAMKGAAAFFYMDIPTSAALKWATAMAVWVGGLTLSLCRERRFSSMDQRE